MKSVRWLWLLVFAACSEPGGEGPDAHDFCSPVSFMDCRELCRADPEWQAWLACPKRNDGTCIDLSEKFCKPFQGPCVCDAMVLFECRKCLDGGVWMSFPDTKFFQVQAVTAFPAAIADDGKSMTRVCGAPLDGESVPAANGFEMTVNLASTDLWRPNCPGERDLAVKEGDYIELTPVTASSKEPTIEASDFTMQVDCLDERAAGTPECKGPATAPIVASAVSYKALSKRCDKDDAATFVNVALVIDHSGSTSGLVDADTKLEESPDTVVSASAKETASDFYNARTSAAMAFIDNLNSFDRMIAYYFDERVGVCVAVSDAFVCSDSGKKCKGKSDTTTCGPDHVCKADWTLESDTYKDLSCEAQQAKAFGSMNPEKPYRRDLEAGIDLKARLQGEGRAPIWLAVDTAATFLASQAAIAKDNKHVVLVTDGPDTCTESENYFNYKDLSGTKAICRTPCKVATVQYKDLLRKLRDLDKQGNHVTVDIVQFQSVAKEYNAPDARMMELACRTGGTYQFINSADFNRSDPTPWTKALSQALFRVRNSLAGSWRVGFKHAALANGGLRTGKMHAIRGSLSFANAKFPSLASTYEYSDTWRFGYSGGATEDRRLLFRKACTTAADCGGTDACGAKHCTEAGLCEDAVTRDGIPCGAGMRCCGGVCGAGECKAACK